MPRERAAHAASVGRQAPTRAPTRRYRQVVGSALYSVLMWLSVLVYGPLALFALPLSFGGRFYVISRWAALQMWLLRVLCDIRYDVRGREHIPPGPAIIMAKHQSTWETFALGLILPPQTWVLKRELLWIPLFGWALALLKPIAIDRRSKAKAVQQVITQGRDRLAAGIWVTVFPEGTRVAPGSRRPWAAGGAVLAARTGYPVVPVAHDAGRHWPRRGFIKRPGTIHVVIGPAIEPHGLDEKQILRRAEEWVVRTVEQLESETE